MDEERPTVCLQMVCQGKVGERVGVVGACSCVSLCVFADKLCARMHTMHECVLGRPANFVNGPSGCVVLYLYVRRNFSYMFRVHRMCVCVCVCVVKKQHVRKHSNTQKTPSSSELRAEL